MLRHKLALALLSAGVSLLAQDAGTLHVNSKLVHVPAVVHDKKGALVLTLKKEDFELWVDKKPQEIRYFNNDANLPLTLGLLVDVSGSMASKLDEERKASSAFLDGMLESDADRAFVIQFGRKADLLADLTHERGKLQEGLKQLDKESPDFGRDARQIRRGGQDDPDQLPSPPSNQFGQWGGMGGQGRRGGGGQGRGQGGPPGGGQGRGNAGSSGTVLYDAVFLASDELMKKQTGRKALIVLTDGDDRGSKMTLAHSLETAQRTDTIIYAIYYKGENGGGGFPSFGAGRGPGGGGRPGGGGNSDSDGKKVLQRMTQETGGQMFEVSKKETVEEIYKEIARELRSQYRIEFTPSESAASEGYHQIDLAPKDKKLFVQTRDGYYVGEPSK